jgi:hypothetical protein
VKAFQNRWILFGVPSLVCSLWLIWAFPRMHPATRFGLLTNSRGYEELARHFASKHMVDTSGWSGLAEAHALDENQFLRLTMPDDPMARHFPDAEVKVTLTPPGNKKTSSTVTLRTDGSVLAWKFPEATMGRSPMNQPDSAMHELAGADSDHYTKTTAESAEDDSDQRTGKTSDLKWQMIEPASGSPHISITETAKDGLVWKADTVYKLPESLHKRLNASSIARISAGVAWTALLVIALGIAVFREGGGRTARAMKERASIRLAVAAALGIAASTFLQWDAAAAEIGSAASVALELLSVVLGGLALGLPCYFILAATVLGARLQPARVRGLRLMGSKEIFTAQVGEEILGGWLAAPMIVALPLIIGAVLRTPVFGGFSDGVLLTPAPVLFAATDPAEFPTLGVAALFGFMIPLSLRFRKP